MDTKLGQLKRERGKSCVVSKVGVQTNDSIISRYQPGTNKYL